MIVDEAKRVRRSAPGESGGAQIKRAMAESAPRRRGIADQVEDDGPELRRQKAGRTPDEITGWNLIAPRPEDNSQKATDTKSHADRHQRRSGGRYGLADPTRLVVGVEGVAGGTRAIAGHAAVIGIPDGFTAPLAQVAGVAGGDGASEATNGRVRAKARVGGLDSLWRGSRRGAVPILIAGEAPPV